MQCLQENLAQPDFGQACAEQIGVRQAAMQSDWQVLSCALGHVHDKNVGGTQSLELDLSLSALACVRVCNARQLQQVTARKLSAKPVPITQEDFGVATACEADVKELCPDAVVRSPCCHSSSGNVQLWGTYNSASPWVVPVAAGVGPARSGTPFAVGAAHDDAGVGMQLLSAAPPATFTSLRHQSLAKILRATGPGARAE